MHRLSHRTWAWSAVQQSACSKNNRNPRMGIRLYHSNMYPPNSNPLRRSKLGNHNRLKRFSGQSPFLRKQRPAHLPIPILWQQKRNFSWFIYLIVKMEFRTQRKDSNQFRDMDLNQQFHRWIMHSGLVATSPIDAYGSQTNLRCRSLENGTSHARAPALRWWSVHSKSLSKELGRVMACEAVGHTQCLPLPQQSWADFPGCDLSGSV